MNFNCAGNLTTIPFCLEAKGLFQNVAYGQFYQNTSGNKDFTLPAFVILSTKPFQLCIPFVVYKVLYKGSESNHEFT